MPAQILASWLIGTDPACDVVVVHPMVSGQHCRLTRYAHEFTLEDLGSTNGTFVDDVRIFARRPMPVTRTQRIALARVVPLQWPDEPSQVARPPERGVTRIGRAPDSDVVLDYPMISWNHARILERNGQFVLEDLNSSNGTAINEVQHRITQATLTPSDDVYLGSFKISASRLLTNRRVVVGEAAFESVGFARDSMVIGRDPQCDHPLNHPMVSWHHARLSHTPQGIVVEDLGSLNGTFVDGTRVTGKVLIVAGQEVGLGSVRFQLLENGSLQRREYQGNVSIQAVEVTVNTPGGSRLLEPISLTVYPSELVALMGPAGAGKTTFLKALNGYTPPAQGRVLFNGADLYRSYDLFRQQMGYVPQDDIVHSQLTVREALYFSAKLRTDLSDKEIDERINTILDELGILDKKGSLIGSPERKVLSGGQRKRVNIALELISDTPVLFLDEPTSGLSSYDAAGVVDLLKRLSQEGKTIIATIHQPSIDVFKKFDNLIMISRDAGGSGALAYFGPAYPDSIEFFHDTPGQAPARTDAQRNADLSPEMLLTGLARATTQEWLARFSLSHYRKQFVGDRAGQLPHRGDEHHEGTTRGVGLTQWLTLVRRNLILKIRDRAQLIILLLQAPLVALLIVLVFSQVKDAPPLAAGRAPVTPDVVQAFGELGATIVGIEFLMVVAAIWFGCNNAARDVVGEWTIFQRERMVNLKLPSYVFSKFAIMCGLCVFQCLALLTIVDVFCDLKGDFAQIASTLILSSLVGAALGLAISAISSTTESAIALLPVVLLPVIALGGGIRAIYRMPAPARLISYAVPSRWAFESNVMSEARGRRCGYLPGITWDSCPGGVRGVDVAAAHVPEAISGTETTRHPTPPSKGGNLRYSFAQSIGALAVMLVMLLSAVLGFLKMRDVH